MPSPRPKGNPPSADEPCADPAHDRPHRAGDILDVHVLDIAAQLEALQRSVRHVQRDVLRLGAALEPDEATPVDEVRSRLAIMRRECGALRDAIQGATDAADDLADSPAVPPEGRAPTDG